MENIIETGLIPAVSVIKNTTGENNKIVVTLSKTLEKRATANNKVI
jgi:hypothetical protein